MGLRRSRGAGIAGSAVAALGGWVLWALLTWLVGTRVLPCPSTSSDPGELLRTIGFSCAPGMLCLLGLVPGLAGPVFVVAGVWMLVAMVVAVRQALDYESTWRAIAVCALGFPLYVVVVGASLLLLGPWPV